MKILLVCIFLFKKILPQQDDLCVSVNSTLYGVVWPSTTNITVSDPPCLNSAKEFAYRTCSNGTWSPEPECIDIQTTLPQCPEDFFDVANLCCHITTKSTFPVNCPFPNFLPFSTYEEVISLLTDEPIWMPVQRDLSNGFGFLQWIEHSPLYKTTFDQKYYYDGTIKEKDCLLYYNSSYIEAVSCNEKHRSVCAYNKLEEMTSQMCGTGCLQSDFDPASKCFCVGKNYQFMKAEFLKPYQNSLYKYLTNEVCSIGMEKYGNGTYIWSNSNQEINYTYWSKNVTFDNKHLFGAATSDGWVLTEEYAQCFLFEEDQENWEPEFYLRFDINGEFSLTVSYLHAFEWLDSNVSINCFTNAHSTDLLYRYSNINVTSLTNITSVYTFNMLKYWPGDYWCESFKYTTSEILTTEVIQIRVGSNFGAEFVSAFQVYYQNINPLSRDIIGYLQENLFTHFDKIDLLKIYYTPRIMKIIDVDEENQQIWINVHFTGSNQTLLVNETEYNSIKKALEMALSGISKIKLINFANAFYCPTETYINLTWPTTFGGVEADAVEYCFTTDGNRLKKQCDGNFMDGFQWSDLNETCHCQKESAMTKFLQQLEVSNNVTFENVYKLSENFSQFYPLDVYLIGDMYNNYLAFQEITDFDTVVTVFSNLLGINKTILAQSQYEMKAPSKIVNFIDDIVSNAVLKQKLCFKNNFGYVLLKNTSAIIIQNYNYTYNVATLNGNFTPSALSQIDNLESAVWLSSSLINETTAFTVYFNDGFFKDKSDFKHISIIFGVKLLFYNEDLKDPIFVLHRMSINNKSEPFCAFWNKNEMTWYNISKYEVSSEFFYCQFYQQGHYALIVLKETEDNVTEILDDLINSNLTVEETMTKLLDVSQKHDKFVSTDISLIGQVLKKVSGSKDVDLDVLTKTISNFHNINRDVLLEGQLEDKATDSMLYYIDVIAQNHDPSNSIHAADNFMLLVYDLKDTNFTGLWLSNYNQILEVEILEGEVNITDLINNEHVDSAFLLSPELKNQLDGKIVVTIYLTPSFFNEKASFSKSVSKIFGIILPLTTDYKGPIVILHKAKKSYPNNCAYWNYNQTTAGFWKNDNKGEDFSTLIQCQFWHTTHFALLLLDEDKYESRLLEWITNITSALSIIGICGIFFTGIIFKNWRSNLGNQFLLNFCFCIFFQIIVFYVSGTTNKDNRFSCTIVGMFLQYFVLAQFCWMLVIAILQFRRFVTVFVRAPKCLLLKVLLFAWGFPLLPVFSVFIADPDSYIFGIGGLCYPSRNGLYFGVWLPIVIALIINFAIFVAIITSISKGKTERVGPNNDGEIVYQWKLAILLFFMLGLTWSFGFLAELNFGLIFGYLFCITVTSQGAVLFLFFVVFNDETKRLYSLVFRNCWKYVFRVM